MLYGTDIYTRRKAIRRTQEQLAAQVQVSASTISNIETDSGRSELTVDLSNRIEFVLRKWEKRVPSAAISAYELGQLLPELSDEQACAVLILAQSVSKKDWPTKS